MNDEQKPCQEPVKAGSECSDGLGRLDGAVWVYPLHGFWCLKCKDGEIIAEISGSSIDNIWTYNGKKYHELKNAKKAVMRNLGAA